MLSLGSTFPGSAVGRGTAGDHKGPPNPTTPLSPLRIDDEGFQKSTLEGHSSYAPLSLHLSSERMLCKIYLFFQYEMSRKMADWIWRWEGFFEGKDVGSFTMGA